MRILIISRGYPSDAEPQWGNFEKEQATALVNYGHQVIMMSINRKFRIRNWFGLEVKEDNGIKSYNLNLPPIFNERFIITIPLLSRIAFWLFKSKLSDEFTPDLIYSHYLNNSILALDIKKKYNIPLVAIEHWSKINQDSVPLYIKLMGKAVYSTADCNIAVSKALSDRIQQHFDRPSVVVNNMVNSTISFVERSPSTSFNFVSVGRLVSSKGFDILIRAFHKIKSQNCRLLIAGDGPERKRLEVLIDELNLSEKVLLLGNIDKELFNELFASSDAFVLASKSETFGLVYAEALMAGLPVIGTTCGGPAEFINDSNGLLVPIDDVEALVNSMEYMIREIKSYDRLRISDECKKRFSSEVISQQLNECFTSVIKNHTN